MKTIILIYIPYVMTYIYLYANIYSNNKNEYNKIVLDSDYYKKIITQLFLIRLPLIIVFFEMYCKNYYNIIALINLVVITNLTKEPLIKYIDIHKGKYYIVREIIDYKITQRYITENRKKKMHYFFRLHNYFKLSSKETNVSKKLFEKFEEKNKVYAVYDNNGNLINIYSAKENITSEKVKEKIIKYEKIEYFNRKYVENKLIINKEELNNIKENEYKKVLSSNKFVSLSFLSIAGLTVYSDPKSTVSILFLAISFVFYAIALYYYSIVNKFKDANDKNEIKVKLEKITKMTNYVNSYGNIGIIVEGQEEYSKVPHKQLGKAIEGSMVYTIYYKNKIYIAFDVNQYVIAKDMPFEKE